ncbi:hypothetical protein [Curtobacterium sp. VKM Ac-1395]|uniref:hypothetical protein n=1 Tax=Curtobacterium sp. VKM Ac-1395 TaxID=2783815 RepID=UPI00188C5181|nr:hypothetical protein [Curtobacterium sp. VKM Ac-1395]MBF4588695.1 hypothetical protein [Curtobacterium sp. VKM Ac-1395]
MHARTAVKVSITAVVAAVFALATPLSASADSFTGNNVNAEIGTNQCTAVSVVTVAEGNPGQNAEIYAQLKNFPHGADKCASAVALMYVNTKGVLYETPFRTATGSGDNSVSAVGKRCQTITEVRRKNGSYYTVRQNRSSTLAACSGLVHHE